MTQVYPTAEVRWFFTDEAPSQVLHWFQRGEREPELQPPREDFYLCLKDRDSLGIKLREGKIEVKQRHSDEGIVRFSERVAGRVEHWRKWSYKLDQAEAALAGIQTPAGAWLGVKKERQLRKYEITDSEQLIPVPASDYPEQGCDIELTTVMIGDQTWWSLCLEAFGDENRLQANLWLAARQIFTGAEPVDFEDKYSYGYARLLMDIC